MSETNYRIFWIDPAYKGKAFHGNRTTVERFYAESDDKAYEHLLEFRKMHADTCKTYYYEPFEVRVYTDRKGIKHEFESCFDEWQFKDADRPFFVKAWDKISLEAWYWFWDLPKRGWYWCRDLAYLVKNKHQYKESWSLDNHILDDILWNIPILLKCKHGISMEYLDEARKILHKDDKDFDLEKYNSEHYNYTDEEDKLAIELQDKSYNEFLRHVKLYNYYRHEGWLDDDTEEAKKLDAELHDTLPIIPGTYDRMEYKKLDAMATAEWKAIWDWMVVHGEGLWD